MKTHHNPIWFQTSHMFLLLETSKARTPKPVVLTDNLVANIGDIRQKYSKHSNAQVVIMQGKSCSTSSSMTWMKT